MRVNIHEAKTHLSRLLVKVAAGEEVVIASNGRPVARLVRYEAGGPRRVFGRYRGQFKISDDFDAPLPDFEDRLESP